MPSSYSLYELNEYIRRVVALNFPEPVWVNAEVAQIKEVRGNVYLDLIHHDEKSNEITAQISANIWYKSHLFLKNKLGNLLPSLLIQGTHLQMKVQVEYSEKYGMKLTIEDIDPAYTIGQMEMKRQKIIQQLDDEGYTQLNKLHILPNVIQRVAVISSETAAGYIDFYNHLDNNNYGYKYKITLFSAALQGLNTEKEVCAALQTIGENYTDYDCIIIVRGGGSKPDLAWFDNYNIGTAIAKSPLPVIVGIGHEIDTTVADILANRSLKTPTAVANFLIDHNGQFEVSVIEITERIGQVTKQMLREYEISLASIAQMIQLFPNEIIRNSANKLNVLHQQIFVAAKQKCNSQYQIIDLSKQQIELYDPINTLKRGYVMVLQDKTIVPRAAKFKKNHPTEIHFYDKIIKINTNE